MIADYTIDAVRTIRRNAGTVTPARLAASLGWTEGRLARVAAQHHVDLRMLVERVAEDASAARRGRPRYVAPSEKRSERFAVLLCPAAAEILRAKAAAHFLMPARMLAKVFEGALARGKIEDLASAAATWRPEPNGKAEP
jgi:hypothetical protein